MDDVKISHVLKEAVEDISKWMEETFSDENGMVIVHHGQRHEFLAITFDFTTPGILIIDMVDYGNVEGV